MLTCEHVSVRLGGKTIVDDLNFTLHEGQWLMLAGPNGAGKSTLIRAIAGGVPCTGRIRLNGCDLRRMKPAQRARQIGVLAQQNAAGYAFTVEELVGLGRYAHTRSFLTHRDDGQAQIESALEMTGLTHLRRASLLTLSGGELQRAFLAQVFAQDPQLLILDEPANHLDLRYQQHIFTLIAQWLQQPGRAVLSVVHDLSLARRFGTHGVLLHGGRCVAQGDISSVMAPENLQAVYGLDVHGWMREMLTQWT